MKEPSQHIQRIGQYLLGLLVDLKPFGIRKFEIAYGFDPLTGEYVTFRGRAHEDSPSALAIKYISPCDPRAVDAVSCEIARSGSVIDIAHYLTHLGRDSRFFSNWKRLDLKEFVAPVISGLQVLSEDIHLRNAVLGTGWIDVPFDWGMDR